MSAAELEEERDRKRRQLATGIQILGRKVREDAIVDKRQNIWWAWRDHVRKERNALNTVFGIGRRLLATEVFMRIKAMA